MVKKKTKTTLTKNDLRNVKRLIKECQESQNSYLDLGKCGITNLNDFPELFECTHVQILDLRYNEISDISFLEKLTELQFLDLSFNQISDYGFLEKLTGLQFLNLCYNEISDISFLEKLTELRSLKISNNKISDISFLEKLTRLKTLDLSYNEISDYSFLENLTELQSLDLGFNKISDISFLENLTGLETLYLSDNQISDISFLEKHIGLKTLYLDNNKISDISFLEKLTKLENLDLCSNNLKKIPLAIFKLEMAMRLVEYGGKGLFLYNNSIESPPIEIIKQGRQSVLDWYEATKKKLDEIKIILIGEPKAGKTSLLRRLKFDKFEEKEVQTDGVNIEDIEFGDCDTFQEQKSLHKLTGHFWDFGGQEIMNATHQFFLTKRSVYILVLDARRDANVSNQIRQWVKRIKATGGNSSIIVVANQIDVNPGFGFESEYELQKEFPQIKYFIKASCSTKKNIDLLKEKLEELIPKAELFDTDIDERWISIKEKLQEETKNKYFLGETRFLEICNEFELKEKREQKNAINFLHDLGLVLHFEEVNDYSYYVLDPYWITYGVYQILTSAYAGDKKGVVSFDKLDFIINEEEDKKEKYHTTNSEKIQYINNHRRFLVDILREFKLCFCLADNSHFIIPDLLDTKEPLNITEPIRTSGESIKFVFEYEYLPKSIMPNIMVETHPKISHMWRTGCVLQNDASKALITNYQNRISIIVTGEYKKKREFMSVIRFIIDSINQELSDKPIALIPLPGVSAFADYERLLIREKNGKQYYIFDEDKSTEKKFLISELLEGIPSKDEVRNSGAEFKEVLNKLDGVESKLGIVIDNQEEIKNKLNSHSEYLIKLLDNNNITDASILDAIKEMNAEQTAEITADIMQWIATAFEHFDGDMDDRLKEIYTDLKKTDNFQMKLKLSVPLIKYLGINLEMEFDVKNWASQMYKKHELKIFKLMGLL